MSYQGNGTFLINTSGNPVVTGTTISSTAFNGTMQDIANGLSTAITKDGQTTPTNNIPLGGNKITGLGNGTASTDAAAFGQLSTFGVPGYTTTATAASTTTLMASSTTDQFFTGTTTQTVVLPVVSGLVAGFKFKIVNDSTGVVTVNSSGSNLVLSMPGGTQAIFTCISTMGTGATSWDVQFIGNVYGPSVSVDSGIALFSGTTGHILKDGGALLSTFVTGPASATTNDVPKFADTTGKVLSDGFTVGTGASNLVQLNSSSQLPAVNGSLLIGVVTPFTNAASYAHFQDQKTSGSAGQSFSSTTWNKRELNTTIVNGIPSVSLASSQLSLPAGTYEIDVEAYVFGNFGTPEGSRSRVLNVTDGANLIAGPNSNAITSAPNFSYPTNVSGRFTLSGTKTVQIETYTLTATQSGAALSTGEPEIYMSVRLWKLS